MSTEYVKPTLEIEGQLRNEMNEGLLEVQITSLLSGKAHLQLRLVNWQTNVGDELADFAFLDLALGQQISVLMQQSGSPQLFNGEITALEERYGNGAPQLVVLAEDKLHLLAKTRNNRVFEEMSINQVIEAVAGDHSLAVDCHVSTEIQSWHQINETDFAFITRLINPFDLAMRIVADQLQVKPEQRDTEAIVIDPQSNADSVRIVADLNRQVPSLRVTGLNLENDSELSAQADSPYPSSLAGENSSAKDTLEQLSWANEQIATDHIPRNQSEADSWAQGAMHKRAKRFLYGDISCRGDSRLACGREIKLQGVSRRLAGRYQVVCCQHLYNAQIGFKTDIKVERSGWLL